MHHEMSLQRYTHTLTLFGCRFGWIHLHIKYVTEFCEPIKLFWRNELIVGRVYFCVSLGHQGGDREGGPWDGPGHADGLAQRHTPGHAVQVLYLHTFCYSLKGVCQLLFSGHLVSSSPTRATFPPK